MASGVLLYLLGGPMRTGKTLAARQFNSRTGISHVSTDDLYYMLGLAAPQLRLGWDSGNSWRENRLRLAPFVSELARVRVAQRSPILIEGELLPEAAGQVLAEFGAAARACFIGSASTTVEAKAQRLRDWSEANGDWLTGRPPELTEWAARECVSASVEYREAAKALGIPYFDLSADFDGGVEAVVEFLAGGRLL